MVNGVRVPFGIVSARGGSVFLIHVVQFCELRFGLLCVEFDTPFGSSVWEVVPARSCIERFLLDWRVFAFDFACFGDGNEFGIVFAWPNLFFVL